MTQHIPTLRCNRTCTAPVVNQHRTPVTQYYLMLQLMLSLKKSPNIYVVQHACVHVLLKMDQ